MHIYNSAYYRYINAGAMESATQLLPLVSHHFKIRSVVDFGAGQGAWLSRWQALGVSDVTAVDGDYIDRSSLLIAPRHFVPADLSTPIRLGRTFDLVQSLEVAEHLAPSAAQVFVNNLVVHGSLVLFSAAPPGQGGEHHVNEQPYDYWRALFREHGFIMLDMIRPSLRTNRAVERWYRYNSFVFIKDSRLTSLSAELRAQQIPEDVTVPDVSPLAYRIRKAVIQRLPVPVTTQLAIFKKHLHNRVTSKGHGRITLAPYSKRHTVG